MPLPAAASGQPRASAAAPRISPATSRRSMRSNAGSRRSPRRPEFHLERQSRAERLLEVHLERARAFGACLAGEVQPAAPAAAVGFHLNLRSSRLVGGLEAGSATALGAPADDLDGDRVLQEPAAALVLPIPARLHLVGKARRREDAEEHVHLVPGLGCE